MMDGTDSEPQPLPAPRHTLRRALKWLSMGYVLLLLVGIILMRSIGERYWMTATAVYFPPTVALLPLALLTPACWYFDRRLAWLHLLVPLLVFSIYLQPHFSFGRDPTRKKIRVLTNNVGERKPKSLTPFINAQDPDIVAIQEAYNRDKFLHKEYPNRFIAVHDEFALVSKWPIKAVGYVPGLFSHFGYAAVWFEVEYQGKPLIIYNIHMPTPRPDFVRLRGQGFLASLIRGDGVYSSKVRSDYKQSMENRVSELKKLAEILSRETRPFLVLGDFNMPDTGYLHSVFASEFTDVFAAKGTGYGLTFPGFTHNPLSLFGPWLRIDYIFAGKHWHPLRCEVESWQNAQHLAVVADLEWDEK